ncbi:MAG: hypothetical protein ABIN91_09575 [Mucilaginibacter sp.]|uniref:hypothetical protein n=1 Tax=Mucilaginibacter sp. TaxID=1882438 RepID=UPI00326334AE
MKMTKKNNKLFPFAWVLLALVIMAFIAYYLYEHRFKGQPAANVPVAKLIEQHENDSTVAAYIHFVSDQNGKMGLDHAYTNEALIKLANAVSTMSKLTGYSIKADLAEAETDANNITRDPLAITHADNIRKAADILSEALYNLQQQKYPSLSDYAARVKAAAAQIDPDTLTLEQKEKVKGFFSAAAALLEKMN